MTRPTRLSVSSLTTGVRGSRRFLPPPPLRLRGGGMGAPSVGPGSGAPFDKLRVTKVGLRVTEASVRPRGAIRPRAGRRPLPPARPAHGKQLPEFACGLYQGYDNKRYCVRDGGSRRRLHVGLRHQPGQVSGSCLSQGPFRHLDRHVTNGYGTIWGRPVLECSSRKNP